MPIDSLRRRKVLAFLAALAVHIFAETFVQFKDTTSTTSALRGQVAKQGHWGHWFRDFSEVAHADGEGHGDRCGSRPHRTHRIQTQSLCRITQECWPTLLVKKILRRTWSLQRWNLLGMEPFFVLLIWLCSSDWTLKVLLESFNAIVTIYSQTGLQAFMSSWVYMNSQWQKTNLQKK